jgi:hypothetical protein
MLCYDAYSSLRRDGELPGVYATTSTDRLRLLHVAILVVKGRPMTCGYWRTSTRTRVKILTMSRQLKLKGNHTARPYFYLDNVDNTKVTLTDSNYSTAPQEIVDSNDGKKPTQYTFKDAAALPVWLRQGFMIEDGNNTVTDGTTPRSPSIMFMMEQPFR